MTLETEVEHFRLWTSLLDEKEHSAADLVEFYGLRWEHELFFRELKSHLHARGNLLVRGPARKWRDLAGLKVVT